eukprot:496537-Pyramimonas_sp.AAC.1
MLCRCPPQVWKDVDGVLSADPRRIPGAIPVPFLTYEEATELAYFGAQVRRISLAILYIYPPIKLPSRTPCAHSPSPQLDLLLSPPKLSFRLSFPYGSVYNIARWKQTSVRRRMGSALCAVGHLACDVHSRTPL